MSGYRTDPETGCFWMFILGVATVVLIVILFIKAGAL